MENNEITNRVAALETYVIRNMGDMSDTREALAASIVQIDKLTREINNLKDFKSLVIMAYVGYFGIRYMPQQIAFVKSIVNKFTKKNTDILESVENSNEEVA